ncbi:MAG TPA: peptidoglycan bridge formation glycyltransferase FemA/FemB family protein [Candidatus Peregrinibacteria bacterium]|nr:peptidoglycan bridge formation glycyltransferase FemA/FemB family protein [Candidatus Peregrinibacteria bacterium]
MEPKIKEVTDKKSWEDFLLNQENSPFLQSWNSGDQFEAIGDNVFRLGVFDGGNLVGVALVMKVEAKRGTFLYLPYGPVLDWKREEYFKALIDYLKILAKEENAIFVRVSPFLKNTEKNQELFTANGFRPAPIHMLAEVLWLLDLSPSEEELMMKMDKQTRYLIRRAEKEGVKIIKSRKLEDVEKFLELHQETVKRHSFTPYPDKYFKEQFRNFVCDDQALMLLAEYQGETLATAMIMYYGDQGSYHHGASTHKFPKIPASYLLQWEAIKEAKQRGKKIYSFWGIASDEELEKNPKHPFKGITLFKKRFGGYRYDLLHCQDLRLSKKYFVNWGIETLRRVKRGF